MLNLSYRRAAGDSAGPPELEAKPILTEVLSPSGRDGAATGFVLSRLMRRREGPVLWIQDRSSRHEAGRIGGRALNGRLWRMELSHPRDVLIAAEEGLRCPALAGVVVELHGNPTVLDFTATKRLALRVSESGVACWLIRHSATPALSAARDRWRLVTMPSALNRDDPLAPGIPRWRAELFRSREGKPGDWVVSHDRGQNRVQFAEAAALAAVSEQGRARAVG